MSISLKDAGVWKAGAPWVKDGGVWKPADKAWVKDAGVWKEIYASGPPPFNLSGSWETGNEGWTLTNVTRQSGSSEARTGNYSLANPYSIDDNLSRADYAILSELGGGLTITASVWTKPDNGGSGRRLRYRINTGAFIDLQTNSDGGNQVFKQLSGSFFCPEGSSCTIRIEGYGIYDDWSISGA